MALFTHTKRVVHGRVDQQRSSASISVLPRSVAILILAALLKCFSFYSHSAVWHLVAKRYGRLKCHVADRKTDSSAAKFDSFLSISLLLSSGTSYTLDINIASHVSQSVYNQQLLPTEKNITKMTTVNEADFPWYSLARPIGWHSSFLLIGQIAENSCWEGEGIQSYP